MSVALVVGRARGSRNVATHLCLTVPVGLQVNGSRVGVRVALPPQVGHSFAPDLPVQIKST